MSAQEMGYRDIADIIRSAGTGPQAGCRELFSRMVFNILIDNTDDHEKNHAFLMKAGRWELSPAFDLQPQLQGLGYQQLRVGKQGSVSSLANAVSEAGRFMLKPEQAITLASGIAACVADWASHFTKHGVSQADIAACKRFILRPELVDLRSQVRAVAADRRNDGKPHP
ncbi:hypothetical protein GCM10022212_26050 [Actimicrobium antarcticum]|uniref:HipA-like C-terminal domain-containing protein n=1 Tax=Actimicrobium antarcticum TaxID=1051899 RepID=A0ABP7TIX5_9BURK